MSLDFFLSHFAAFYANISRLPHTGSCMVFLQTCFESEYFPFRTVHISYQFANSAPTPQCFFHSVGCVTADRRCVVDGLLTSNHILVTLRVMILGKKTTTTQQQTMSLPSWGVRVFSLDLLLGNRNTLSPLGLLHSDISICHFLRWFPSICV